MQLTDVIEQFIIDAENKRRADGTIVIYRRVLGMLERWLKQSNITELELITLALLRQFLNFLMTSHSDKRFPDAVQKGRLAASTLATYVAMVKAFFKWCYDEELISTNPAARLKKPMIPKKVVAALTAEQIDSMLSTCNTDTVPGFRNYVMLLLMLDTGVRVSELCTLQVINVHPRYIKVFGKGSKEREIGLHADVSKLLWKYIQKYRGESSYGEVFVGSKGPLTVSGVETIFDNIQKACGLEHVHMTPHTMRHTFSKRYLTNGGDLFKLSRELGHSSVQITGNVYLGDFKSEDARQDHDKFSPIEQMNLGKVKDGEKKKKQPKK